MQTGHCGATVDGEHGDCDLGDKGWIGLRPSQSRSWDSARRACVAACRDCDRCRFVSFSLQYKDCSWYHSCESLVTKPEGFRLYWCETRRERAWPLRVNAGDMGGGVTGR